MGAAASARPARRSAASSASLGEGRRGGRRGPDAGPDGLGGPPVAPFASGIDAILLVRLPMPLLLPPPFMVPNCDLSTPARDTSN